MKYEQRLEAIISGGVDPSLTDVPDSTLIEWLGLLAIEVRMSRESIAKVRGRLQVMRKGLQARKGRWLRMA